MSDDTEERETASLFFCPAPDADRNHCCTPQTRRVQRPAWSEPAIHGIRMLPAYMPYALFCGPGMFTPYLFLSVPGVIDPADRTNPLPRAENGSRAGVIQSRAYSYNGYFHICLHFGNCFCLRLLYPDTVHRYTTYIPHGRHAMKNPKHC